MRSSHSLDRLDTAFDDDRLVADAGLLLPATLARKAREDLQAQRAAVHAAVDELERAAREELAS